MTWYPIAFVPPQLDNSSSVLYSGAVLKAYRAGTSTVINMATSSAGTTTATSFALNASGYPVYSGNIIIPHVEENFKLALYPTQAAADANSGAVWTYDNIVINQNANAVRYLNFAADTGSANTYSIAPDPAISAYSTGDIVTLDPANANTGASTIVVNGLTAKDIKLPDGTALYSGAMLASGIYFLQYNGTYFVLMNPSPIDEDSFASDLAGAAPSQQSVKAYIAATGANLLLNTGTAAINVGASDKGKLVELTGSTNRTWTFTAAATLGDGWWCYLVNNSSAELTLDPDGAETIDGQTSYIMYPGELRLVRCTGTAFTSSVLRGFTVTYDASGTFSLPPGYKQIAVEGWGGGGAGGGSSGTTNGGGGGGGGAYLRQVLLSSAISSPVTVTIGAGGTAVTAANGNAGGNTTFGSYLTAYGGGAGGGGAAQSGGGGGGGWYSVGANGSGTTPGTGGLGAPGATATAADAAANLLDAGSGGRNASSNPVSAAGAAVNGGGGGGGYCIDLTQAGGAGGASVYGGGGGGGSGRTSGAGGAGGTSRLGGSGGAGGNQSTTGTAGTQPGGGGGGAQNSNSSGAGAAGRCRVGGLI